MKKRFSAVITLLLLLALLFVPHMSARAEGSGRISVTLKTQDGAPLAGSELTIYTVALPDAAAERGFTLTDAFSGSGFVILDNLEEHHAASLASFAAKNHVAGAAAIADDAGVVTFSSLADGLYLIAQREPFGGYAPISPFFVFVPTVNDYGIDAYHIEAQPKPVPKLPDTVLPLKATKKVACAKDVTPPDEVFRFILIPEDASYPMPKLEGVSYRASDGAMTVSRTGAGTIDFGSFSFSHKDAGKTYRYTLREVAGDNGNYTYDKTEYKITVTVSDYGVDSNLSATYTVSGGSVSETEGIVFVNTYDSTTPDTPVPNTGQVWWPVPLMACAGVLLIGAGVIRRRFGRGEPDEA